MRTTGLGAFALGLAFLLQGCVSSTPPRTPDSEGGVSLPAQVRVRVGDRVRSVPLEEYIVGTTLAEIGPGGEAPDTVRRVFEVQSILARTYATAHLGRHAAEGFDLCDTTHCQVYEPARMETSRFADAARRAAAATAGRVLVFAGRPIQALFHADCGGQIAPADAVWGGNPVAYLRGGDDDVPRGTHREWQFTAEPETLARALALDPRSDVGRLQDIEVTERDASGRAEMVRIAGDRRQELRGDHFRAIVTRTFGVRSILSTRFTVTRRDGRYLFAGTGFGHGVGLCQVGAMARARQGQSVTTILAAYYPGAEVRRH